MKFTDIFIKRPVLAFSISVLIVISGLVSFNKLNVRQYPKIVTNVISVSTSFPGASSEVMQTFVTSALEEEIAQVDNIDYMQSDTSPGKSTINIKMALGTQAELALSDIAAKVNAVRKKLPKGIDDPVVTNSSGDLAAPMYIGFNSEDLSASQIAEYLNRVVKPALYSVPGISKINVLGGADFALRVWIDPDKLASLYISADEILQSMAANNVQAESGGINGLYSNFSNNATTTTPSVKELKQLPIAVRQGKIIRLSDVADIALDKSHNKFIMEANGKESVVISIEVAPQANPLTVIKDVYPVLGKIQSSLPNNIHSLLLYDATKAVNESIHEVIVTIVLALLIVLIVIIAFLGSWRVVIIPMVTLPISIIGVFFLLQLYGGSINLMTLLAIILSIGLVVDDAIVVVENIDRQIKQGKSIMQASIMGTREIAIPIISMTIATCAVYSPIVFIEGITGNIFKEFALTVAGSVFISGVAALTLSPMMCSKLLQKKETVSKIGKLSQTYISNLTQKYHRAITQVLQERKTILVFGLIILCLLPFMIKNLSSELTPTEDKGVVFMQASAPSNANIEYTKTAMDNVKKILNHIPEIEYQQIMTGIPNENGALALGILKTWANRSKDQKTIVAEIQQQAKNIPEIAVQAFPIPEIATGSSGLPVQFVLLTPNSYEQLALAANDILIKANNSGQFIINRLDLQYDNVAVEIEIDKQKASAYGVSMNSISSTLSQFLSGGVSARVNIDGRAYTVITQVKREHRLVPNDIKRYFVKSALGEMIPLDNIVSLKIKPQPTSLRRLNQLNSAVIGGVPINSVGDAVQWYKQNIVPELPQGYQYDLLGESRQLQQESNSLFVTFLLSLVIILLVLGIQFESLKDALVILISVPLAISGSLFFLNLLGLFHINGATLNIYSEIGIITLVGLITKHGILMCEVAKEEQILKNLTKTEAIINAAVTRFRPILMTTSAMIAGLIPLLFATGAGAVSRFSIGLVIVSGLAVGTIFTLFVLPVIYTYLGSTHKALPEVIEE